MKTDTVVQHDECWDQGWDEAVGSARRTGRRVTGGTAQKGRHRRTAGEWPTRGARATGMTRNVGPVGTLFTLSI